MLGLDNPFLNGSLWDDLQHRDDDIIIATYAKFGRLRMQIIIGELVKASTGQQHNLLPWLELRHQKSKERIYILNKFNGRRILRTHLTADKVYKRSGKYVFIGRDPRDLVFNLFHFFNGVSQEWCNHFNRNGKPLQKLTQDFESFWEEWMEQDGIPLWPYFSHLRSWWEKRDEPNVLLIHFLDFKSNMEKELRRISRFLDLNIAADDWPMLLEYCGYERVSEACLEEAKLDNPIWNGGDKFHHGRAVTRGWEDFLTDSHQAELEYKLSKLLDKPGKDWVLKAT